MRVPMALQATPTKEVTTMSDLQRRETAAYFYAAGFHDGAGGMGEDHASDFAAWARADAADYYAERTFHLRSVPQQYAAYVADLAARLAMVDAIAAEVTT